MDNSVDNVNDQSDGQMLGQFDHITTRSSVMARILEEAHRFSVSSGCVLIQGESGTGKELMAQGIHRHSHRAHKPYVTLNCCALNEGLLESELFGHSKGAFTGADRHKDGFFTLAKGGTLFLDEIGDMPLRLQAKLLRVLQNQTFHPVGSTELKTTDVRIIAATNVNLIEAVKKKRFRLDLYYRLNVLPIEMPPLRQRLEDIPHLAANFIAQTLEQEHRSATSLKLTHRCVDILSFYPWPGNIRELENLMTRLVITQSNLKTIDIEELPLKYRCPPGPPQLYETPQSTSSETSNSHLIHTPSHTSHPEYVHGATKNLNPLHTHQPTYLSEITPSLMLPASGINLAQDLKDLEHHMITQALSIAGYNKNKAAALIGMKRTTLTQKLKKYQDHKNPLFSSQITHKTQQS